MVVSFNKIKLLIKDILTLREREIYVLLKEKVLMRKFNWKMKIGRLT
jgi:hypothetical protein